MSTSASFTVPMATLGRGEQKTEEENASEHVGISKRDKVRDRDEMRAMYVQGQLKTISRITYIGLAAIFIVYIHMQVSTNNGLFSFPQLLIILATIHATCDFTRSHTVTCSAYYNLYIVFM